MEINEITEKIIGCAIRVHSELGPGLLESAYKACLIYELQNAGLMVKGEYPIPLIYNDIKMDCGYRADILVENKVVVETKAVDFINDIHLAQVLTHLKLANCEIGLLINFNVIQLKDGIRRLINKYYIRPKSC